MEFGFSQEQERFRREVRDFLDELKREGVFSPAPHDWSEGYNREFLKRMAEKGWIGLFWPKEHGGQGRSDIDKVIFYEELVCAGAPFGFLWSIHHRYPYFLERANKEVRDRLLPKVLIGEVGVCVGQIEPDGHYVDFSLKTKIVADGDDYIINGEKCWTTGATYRNDLFVVCCVLDPDAPKDVNYYKWLLVDPSTPGINVRPVVILSGHEVFGHVTYDNVRVPKENLLGPTSQEEVTNLSGEFCHLVRLWSGYCGWEATLKYIKETKRDGKPLSQDPAIRSKVAQIEIDREIGRLLNYRVGVMRDNNGVDPISGGNATTSGSQYMAKVYGAEFQQREANTITEILGLYSQLMPASELGPIVETTAKSYLYTYTATLRSYMIEALWCHIAMGALGLPSYINPPRMTA